MRFFFNFYFSKTFRTASAANDVQKNIPLEQDFESSECDGFLKSIRRCYQLLTIESMFINKLIGNQREIKMSILDKIYEPVIRFLKVEAEVMNS